MLRACPHKGFPIHFYKFTWLSPSYSQGKGRTLKLVIVRIGETMAGVGLNGPGPMATPMRTNSKKCVRVVDMGVTTVL
jgi:hypothetical protein